MTEPAPKSYDVHDSDALNLVTELLNEARSAQKKFLPRWNRYYRAFRNRTWSENRAAHLPSPQSPQLFPTFHTLCSYMTDQFPIFYVEPSLDFSRFTAAPPLELVNAKAKDMETVLASWWVTSGAHTQTQMALFDAMLFGSGILKTGLNLTGCNGLGEASLSRVDPYAILPDPSGACMEDIRYIHEVHRVPLFEVMRRFPARGHLVNPDGKADKEFERPKVERGSYNVMSQSNLSATGVTGDFPGTSTPGVPPLWSRAGERREDYTQTVRLVETWVRSEETTTVPVIEDGERVHDMEIVVPYWEFIATANGVVLTEEQTNPFPHGQLPYVRLPHVEIGEFWSMPLSEQLLPAQIALNRLLAAVQTSAELTGNPIFIEPESAGISRTKITNRPGGRITVAAGATQFIRWLDPPRMGADVIQLIGYWQDVIDRTSGVTAVARGTTLRRREAAASVDAVQEASFSRIRAVLRNYEEALRQCANQVISNMVEFYVEPRVIPVVGTSGAPSLQLGHKHFWVPQPNASGMDMGDDVQIDFQAWVQAGSSLPLSRTARMAEAMELRKAGAIDDLEVLKAADWPNAEEVNGRAKQQLQQMAEAEAVQRGQGG